MKNKIHKPNLRYIKIKKSKIHNNGIFAKKNIKKGIKIIEYIGEMVSKDEGNKRAADQYKLAKKNKHLGSVYVFELNKKYDLDGNFKHNIARFINHSCEPNCRFTIKKNKIWIIAKKNIKKGEELNYDYGYDLEDYKSHKCRCRSDNCLGYIVAKEHRKKLKKILAKKKK